MENKLLETLQLCPLFVGMTAVEIGETLKNVDYRIVDYKKNEIFVLAGMPCRHADIVLGGTLVCKMTSFSGRQIEVSRLREGNLIAPAFILGKDRAMPVSVETATHVQVLRLSTEAFRLLLEGNGHLCMNFVRALSNINVFLTRKLRVLSLFTVREKVAWLLLKRAEEQGSDSITLLRSRQEIADSFGIQKFSLVRILSDLEKEGAISVHGREITIIDRKRLRGF